MRREATSSRPNSSNAITNSTLLLIGAIGSAVFFWWKSKRPSHKDRGFGPNDPIPYLPGTNPYESSTFYKLRLPKRQYDLLRSYEGNSLVLQFFYPEASECGSPTLFAYKMKRYHQATGKPPVILSYGEESKEPLRGRSQVLGDQQIEVTKIDDLIKRVTGSKKGNYNYLVFNPVFFPDNPHIGYEITVDGSSDSATCDPSPPATAV